MQKQIHIQPTEDDHRIAKLSALAIGLHLIEAVFPSPLPGVKPGIANIVVLYVMYQYDFKTAVWVSLLRVVVGSLIYGQFLSPTFVLSLSGAMASLLVLAFAQYLPIKYFSAVSLSIFAALGHVLGQIIIVRLWLIPDNSIFVLTPIFALAAVFFGFMNGLIVNHLRASWASKVVI